MAMLCVDIAGEALVMQRTYQLTQMKTSMDLKAIGRRHLRRERSGREGEHERPVLAWLESRDRQVLSSANHYTTRSELQQLVFTQSVPHCRVGGLRGALSVPREAVRAPAIQLKLRGSPPAQCRHLFVLRGQNGIPVGDTDVGVEKAEFLDRFGSMCNFTKVVERDAMLELQRRAFVSYIPEREFTGSHADIWLYKEERDHVRPLGS